MQRVPVLDPRRQAAVTALATFVTLMIVITLALLG